MTRKAPEPSRPAATAAKAMLGPVVARAGFVGLVRGAAAVGVADGLAGVPVVVTVSVLTVVAGADGVDGVVSGVGSGERVSAGGVLLVDGGVLLLL